MKIQKIAICNEVMKVNSSVSTHGGSSAWFTPTSLHRCEAALRSLDAAFEKDRATHESNAEAIKTNHAIRQAVEALMSTVGMPKSFAAVDTNSRARFPKRVTRVAGYLSDLAREVIVDDRFPESEKRYAALKEAFSKALSEASEEAQKKAAARATEEAAEKARLEAEYERVRIIMAHDLPKASTWDDILDALRRKDQRIDLAIAMMDTRGDWSEGYYRVSDAIDRFKIETTEDKNIAAELVGLLRDPDFIDGRVFRDCSWNYDRLMASVIDQGLAKDALIARENRSR